MQNEAVEAVVQAAGEETAYVRAGSGRPVVLLLRQASALGAITADPLFVRLSQESRVVAPAVPADLAPSGWVRDVIDGLGLDRPALVVDAAVAGAAIRVAVAEDRCGCLTLLHAAPAALPAALAVTAAAPAAAPAAAAAAREAGHPAAWEPCAATATPDFAHECRRCGVRLLELRLGPAGDLESGELDALLAFLRCAAE